MNGSTRVVDYLPIKEAAKFLTERTGRKFKKLDIFQEARNGHITLSADFLATTKVNIGTVELMFSLPGSRVQYEEYRHNPHFGVVSGTYDLWIEAPGSNMHEVIDGDLQIGRTFPDGLHFRTDRLLRVVELLNDDGTKAKKLPKDARWVVRRSSLERYLNPNAAPAEEETFQSRIQAYSSLEWLTLEQASDWIEIISGSAVDDSYLYAMAEFGYCSLYVDALGLEGQAEVKQRPFTQQTVRGLGICEVTTPLVAKGENTYLYGPAELIGSYDDDRQEPSCSWWISPNQYYEPLFKPTEVEKIGKMTTASGWSNSPEKDRHWSHALRGPTPTAETRAYVQSGDVIDTVQDSNGHPSHENESDSSIAEHDLSGARTNGVSAPTTMLSKQKQAITETLIKNGYDPKALPKFNSKEHRKGWVKGEAWSSISVSKELSELFTDEARFKAIWGKMTGRKELIQQT